MTNKIKLLFIFLAVTAVLSVFSFFDVFSGVRSALLEKAIESLPAPTEDTDNDGLSDSEESYWNTDFQNPDTDGDGFLDGEEVVSRHDPTVPGPNDRLADINITQKAANIAISGLVEGSLKPGSPNYTSSLDSVSLAVVDDGLKTFMSYPEDSKLNIVDSSSENQQAYVLAIEPVWEQLIKSLGDEVSNIGTKLELTNDGGYSNPDFISYFIFKREEFKSISSNWQAIPVPNNWKEEHANLLNLTQEITKINEALAKGGDDPIRATIGLTLFIDLVEDFSELVNIYSEKIKAENLQSNLF